MTKRPRFAEHSRETFDAVLDLAEQIATDHFAPHNRKADENEPRFVDGKVEMIPEVSKALKVFADAGLMAGSFDEEYGGVQLPHTVGQAVFAWFKAANVGTSAYPFLTMGNARLLLAHGTPEQIDTFVRPELEGRWFGTMALTGPPRPPPRGGPSVPPAGPSPSRRPARRWPTSRHEPSPRTTAPTGAPATRCGSPAATTSRQRTSSIWCWRTFPTDRPA